MYEAGIDALTAKEQLGHADIKTTLSIYTHLSNQHKETQVNKLDAFLQKGSQRVVSQLL
jgi:integrase